jgi:hypothetical protein
MKAPRTLLLLAAPATLCLAYAAVRPVDRDTLPPRAAVTGSRPRSRGGAR